MAQKLPLASNDNFMLQVLRVFSCADVPLQSLLDDLDVVEIFSGCSATWMHSQFVWDGPRVSEHELLSHGNGSGNLLAGTPARFQIQTDGYPG